jgi:hypothetical protein
LIVAVTTGIASSLAASFLFWFVLYRKKPVVEVSSQILKVLDHEGNPKHYLIKVVNHTKADITNVKYELILEKISSRNEMEIDTSGRLEKILSRIKNETPRLQKKSTITIFKTPLKLGLHGDRKELMAIEKYIHPIKDVNGEALYAQLFAIVPQHQPGSKSLDELLADNNLDRPYKYLVFNLYAEHSTSGFGQFFSKKYSQSDIHDGKRFKWGKSTEIE